MRGTAVGPVTPGAWTRTRPTRPRLRRTRVVPVVAAAVAGATTACSWSASADSRSTADQADPTGTGPAATAPTPATSTATASGGQDASATTQLPRSPASSTSTRAGPVTVALAGDVHAEGVAAAVVDGLGPVSDLLAAADVAVVNLESAIVVSAHAAPEPKQYTYAAPPEVLDGLAASGVDVVSMANNHGLDFGDVGLSDTLAAVAERERPAVVGIGGTPAAAWEPAVTTANGRTVGVLAASDVLYDLAWAAVDGPGLASAKHDQEQRLLAETAALAERTDVTVVYLHWGTMRDACPTQRQRSLARALVDAGADVVAGAHAHVVQPVVDLDGATVAYGLGNFAWYHSQPPTNETGVLTVTVDPDGRQTTRWDAARVEAGLPVPTGEVADRPTTACD